MLNRIKIYFKLLAVNHYTRLVTATVLSVIGSIFGYDGIAEIKSMTLFFDILMYIGVGVLSLYAILLTICGIYYGLGGGYQVGSYNKWKDGDFEEWKKKNNIGNSWFDKFIDGFDRNFQTKK